METIELKITGVSPLLLHSTNGMKQSSATGTKSRSVPTPEEEAELGTYRDADGNLVFPTVGFRSGLIYASANLKVGKITAKRALAGFYPDEEFTVLTDPDSGEILTDYELDIRPARVGTARIMRTRARLNHWGHHTQGILRSAAD